MAKYDRRSKELFVNPYNFVPVDIKNTKREDITRAGVESMSGYLDCRVICRTPLAIPDVSKAKEIAPEHNRYPFYTTDGVHPVIPGSSLRGVIRSAYETLTDSCFGTMQKDTRITVRSNKPFAPGLLVREGDVWKLYQAERRLIVTDRRFYETHPDLSRAGVNLYQRCESEYKTGQMVTFCIAAKGREPMGYYKNRRCIGQYVNLVENEAPGARVGYICIGEKAPRRHFQSVFEKGEAVRSAAKEDIEQLEAVLNVYRDNKINRMNTKEHTWYSGYEKAKKAGVIPVYYNLDHEKLYMTFAALGRKAYYETLNEKSGEKSHQKCDSRTNLCPACALFGTTEGEKLGSRVRFTDAECMNYSENSILKNITFEELGSPRISYLPFYLRSGRGEKKEKIEDYVKGYDHSTLEIRGRKYYWHFQPQMNRQVRKTKRNATFDVLKGGTEFRFRIYFDQITERQLELLAASVHLNENDSKGHYCHKIGHGKPLGYGSVKIVVEKCCLREFSVSRDDGPGGWRETERQVPCSKDCCECKKETYDAMMKICDFDALSREKATVSYPGVVLADECKSKGPLRENVLANHQWFTANYSPIGKRLDDVLPEILEEDHTLSKREVYDITPKNLDNKKPYPTGGQKSDRSGNNRRNDSRRAGATFKKKR